jgi:hypothetical protein
MTDIQIYVALTFFIEGEFGVQHPHDTKHVSVSLSVLHSLHVASNSLMVHQDKHRIFKIVAFNMKKMIKLTNFL